MKKEFIDHVHISDSKPRGVVSGYQDGKLLFTKENTIVAEGRKNIFYSFCNNMLPDDIEGASDIKTKLPKIAKIALGSGNGVTTVDFNKDSFKPIGKDGSEKDITEILSSVKISDSERCLSFTDISFASSDDSYTARELALIDEDGNIFSRLAFDPVYIGSNATFEITYKIYF